MTASRTPPPGLSVEDAAAYWLARCDADPATAADPAFLTWLAQSETHAQAWARAQAIWRRAAQDLKEDPLADALRASALAVRPPIWPRAAAAAAIVAVIGLGALGGWRYWAQREDPRAGQLAASTSLPRFVTRVGELREVALSDGTHLTLDSDTRVDVAFDDRARRLILVKGRAYIQVGHDAGRPFAVDAGDQTIVDRGTAFGVRLDPDKIAVMLVEGEVAVGTRGAAPRYALQPGQRLVLQAGRPARVEHFDPKTALAWREGFVEFSDTPLSEAVAEMNRHGGQQLVIVDPSVGAMKISGRFKLGDPDRFMRTVALLLPVRAVPVGDTLEIRATR